MSEPLSPSRIDKILSQGLRDDPVDEPDIFTARATSLQDSDRLAPIARRHKLFLDRFSKVSKEFLIACVLKKLDQKNIEEQVLSAMVDEAKAMFNQKEVTIEDLEDKLPDVSEADRDARGVYCCIVYDSGYVYIYVGSSGNIFARIVLHDRRIRRGDTSITLYKTISGTGLWRCQWKTLARFPHGTHQSFSYLLEAICMIVFRPIDNSKNRRFHNRPSPQMYLSLFGNEDDEDYDKTFDFEIQPINHQTPLLAGWSMLDTRDKTCVQCKAQSKNDLTSKQWCFAPGRPFEAYICVACYLLNSNKGAGTKRKRDETDQQSLEAKHDQKRVRGVVKKGSNPPDCDWCGKNVHLPAGITSNGKKRGKRATILNDQVALCLCKKCHDQTFRNHALPDPATVKGFQCALCRAEHYLEFVPYPVKKFMCGGCRGGPRTVYNQLVAVTKADHQSRTTDYHKLLVEIQQNWSLIQVELRDEALLSVNHGAFRPIKLLRKGGKAVHKLDE